MKTIKNLILIAITSLAILSCKKTENKNVYSDCSGAMKVTFTLTGDWNYKTCETGYMALSKPDETYWIAVDKIKTNQTSIDSMVNSDQNIFNKGTNYLIERKGQCVVSNNNAYLWEWIDYDYNSKFEAYVTYKDGYYYRFKFMAKDSLIFNNNKKEFEDFINSIKINN